MRGSTCSKSQTHHETSVIYTRIRQGAAPSTEWQEGRSTFYIRASSHDKEDGDVTPTQIFSSEFPGTSENGPEESGTRSSRESKGSLILPVVTSNHNPAAALLRLYLMAYFPSGFWPRLITRLLGDETFYNICMVLYEMPDVLASSDEYMKQCWSCPKWKCWQTGLELQHLGATILRIKEVDRQIPNAFCDYRQCRLVVQQEHDLDWNDLNLQVTSILEILLPNESLSVQVERQGMSQESQVIQPNPQVVAALLAKVVEHLDTLLEDWYPDLGARFIQNTRGMYLITRVVPCTRCILQQIELQRRHLEASNAWALVDVSPVDSNPLITQPILIDPPVTGTLAAKTTHASSLSTQESPQVVDSQFRFESALAGGAGDGLVNTAHTGGHAAAETVVTNNNNAACESPPTWRK